MVYGSQDYYAHSRIAVYLADGGTKSLSRGSGWDVACLYMEDGSGVHGPFSSSITFQPGWSHIHIVGYNQNQGFNYQLTSALTSMFDVVAPDPVTIDTNAAQYLTGDFNGDGLTDIGVVKEREVYLGLSDGSQFVEQSVWPITFGSDGYTSADYNGDGLSDLAWFDKSSGTVYVGYSDGAGFSAPEALPLTFTLTAEEDQIQIGELNGDGLPDLGVFDPISGDIEMALSSGSSPDLLVEIDNGIGGVSGISYQPSTTMDNDFLPLIMPVVTHSQMADGMGNVYTTRYTYAHGLYDSDTREFRGFGEVDVYDAESVVTITEFHQDPYNKGRPYRMSVKDADGNLWSKAEKTWQSTTPFPGLDVFFTYLEQVDEFIYDGDATYKQTRTRFAYDSYGNLTSSYMEGDVDVVGDERQTLTTFNANETAWILSTPSRVQTLDADSNLVAQVRFRYDGAVDDATPPTHGNLTQEAEWLNLPTVRWLPAEMTYDDCGNMLTASNAEGHSISNTYDATGTYLETVRNSLGHTRQTVYNPRNGQKVSETDANGVTSIYTYDALGRKTASSITDPGSGLTHVVSELEYDTSAVPVRTKITAYALPGKQGALVSYQFSDGLGRNLQTRAPAENPARQVVTGAVEYDSKGQVKKQWAPYLDDYSESFVSYTTVSGLANPGQYEYDPMGRVVKIISSNGEEESITYDDWSVEMTDARNHVNRKTRDAHGRLVEVQEHNDGEIYTTTYEYDALDNLVHTVDHAGNESFMTYDSQNRRLSMNDPDMGLWTYTYDDVDNLVEQTDARGVTVTHTYDALNRLTRKSFTTPDGCGVYPQPDVVYEYDDPAVSYAIGKLTRMTDASGVVEFEYDCYNRVTSETRILDGQDYSLDRGYDLMGRLPTPTITWLAIPTIRRALSKRCR
jgi:YD repeat-containing protein